MPASEYFVTDLHGDMIERSRNNIPYPKLEHFAQSLVNTQRWAELAQLVDGMDLDEEWGGAHLNLDKPSPAETEYVATKNKKIKSSCDEFPGTDPRLATLTEKPVNRMKKWQSIVQTKESRIGPHLPKERYVTQFRRKGSQDPRLREDSAV